MSETKYNYPSNLQNIKNELEAGNMSSLVGAGFSKNFSYTLFPSWWQLLIDMVKVTHEPQFKEQYQNITSRKGKSKPTYHAFLEEKINAYIDQIGPLKAVSKYIEKMGYREAADHMIENNTPIVELIDGKRYITYQKHGEAITTEITRDQIRIHEKFVTLPWNNIYTTNYDNLLESSIDINIEKEFKSKISQLEETLKGILETITKSEEELIDLENKLVEAEAVALEKNDEIASKPDERYDPNVINKLRNDILLLNSRIEFQKDQEKSTLEKRGIFERHCREFSSSITHSADLAFKKKGNIVKIHGSVRTSLEREYGFDGDNRIHYVIAEEDYNTYPEKHQAFTQLMRISLLQETFCLIGFSGIDPNFLAWVGWVRDIIERKKNTKESQLPKIYLFDITSGPPKPELELFYSNHRICFIPLGSPETIHFLQEQTGRSLPKEPKPRDLVELFIDFLSLDARPNKFAVALELTKQEDYSVYMRQLPSYDTLELHDKIHAAMKQAPALLAMRPYNRIPELKEMQFQAYFIELSQTYIKNLKKQDELFNALQVIRIIIEDHLIPVKGLFSDFNWFHQLVKLAKNIDQQLYHQYLIVELKDAVWNHEVSKIRSIENILKASRSPEISNELIYQKTLFELYNLRFDKAFQLLDAWEANSTWIPKKARLLGLKDLNAALDLLRSSHPQILQEQLYQLQLMATVAIGNSRQRRIDHLKQIERLEEQGLRSLHSNIDYLIERLNRTDEKILPYGKDKLTISHKIIFSAHTKYFDSMRLFGHMQESGLNFAGHNANYFASTKVYPAFKETLEEHPFPILFFTMQFNDENFVLRNAQDYIFSEKLYTERQLLSDMLQSAYLEESTPDQVKKNILIFYSVLLNTLRPTTWERFFVKVWQQQLANQRLFNARHFDKNHFINSGLRFIDSVQTSEMVINDLLQAVLDKVQTDISDTATSLLYELAHNLSLKVKWKHEGIRLNSKLIESIIGELPDNLNYIFLLGNINTAIPDAQRNQLYRKLMHLPKATKGDEKVWRILLYFSSDKPQVISLIKSNILHNERLWDAGFTEKGISGAYNYISLYRLRRGNHNHGIDWTKNEAVLIYKKLEKQVLRIADYVKTHSDLAFTQFGGLLDEMKWFLDYESEKLKDQRSFTRISKTVQGLVDSQKGYVDILSGLVSGEKSQVLLALNEISYQIYNHKKFQENDKYFNLILNKIILKDKEGLEACLERMSDWIYAFRTGDYFKEYSSQIEDIIELYLRESIDGLEPPFVEEKLVTFAFVLQQWGSKNEFVLKALGLLKESRFNTITRNLKIKLSQNIND